MSYHNINQGISTSKITDTNSIKLIKSVNVDTSPMRSTSANRNIKVSGDNDAKFSIQVSRSSDNRYYDFTTNSFEATSTSRSRLRNQNPGIFNISLPANASGDTYIVWVFAEPHYNTWMYEKGNVLYKTKIIQVGDSTITFATNALGTALDATAIGTSTGSITDKYTKIGCPTVVMNNSTLIAEIDEDTNYGFFIKNLKPTFLGDLNNGIWKQDALYWETTAADHVTTSASTHDAGSTSTALVLNNVDGLYVGMHVSYIETVGALTTMPTITDINIDTLTVTLSAAQTWGTPKEITFRAYGVELILKTTGMRLSLSNPTCKLEQISTTVRVADAADPIAYIDVNGTNGVAVGATVRCKFIDKSSNGDPCTVSAISGAVDAGRITVTNGQFNPDLWSNGIRTKEIIYIDGSSSIGYISGTISVIKYPTANQNVYIDLTRIFTAGTGS